MSDYASFKIDVSLENCTEFAVLSGDWNPLHTDKLHAQESVYGRQVLHGAFSAGLFSRLAGMHLPGKECLLHGLKLKFVSPILPPSNLEVSGRVISRSSDSGTVDALIKDSESGKVYVSGSYDFGYHKKQNSLDVPAENHTVNDKLDSGVMVTGASGGIGSCLSKLLGDNFISVSRSKESNRIEIGDLIKIANNCEKKIDALVHCAWPEPDNSKLINIENTATAIDHQVSGPLSDMIVLGNFLAKYGNKNAVLVLLGSTFSTPGRHYFRTPLYSLGKSMIPTLVNILSLELAVSQKRCVGLVFDMLDGGMNKGISASSKQMNADRTPWSELGTPLQAAQQIQWVINNSSHLVSGSTITLSAGSLP